MATKSLGITKFSGIVRPATAELNPNEIQILPQIRTDLGDLTQLREDIAVNGISVRIIVSVEPDGTKQLIAGERRLRCAIALGLPRVPAELKYDLSDYDKRKLQINENNNRVGLSAYDEVAGIARDVELYGTAKAMELWGNKSKAWLSKRMSASKLNEELTHLLQSGVLTDIELLVMLHQLLKKDLDRYASFMKRVRSGRLVSREEVRLALERAKERQAEAASADANSADDSRTDEVEVEVEVAGDELGVDRSNRTKSTALKERKPPLKHTAADVERIRDQIFSFGRTLGKSMEKLEEAMADAGLSDEDRAFARWVAFVDAAMPMLATSSKANAKAMFTLAQRAMANREIKDVWKDLHGDERAPTSVPQRPEDWEH